MFTHSVFDIAYVGNYTKDTIVTPEGTSQVDGGAIYYATHAGISLGFKVAVVTHLAQEDYNRVICELAGLGATCIVAITPHSTCLRLEYPTANMDVRNLKVTATAGVISVHEVDGFQAQAAVIACLRPGSSPAGPAGLSWLVWQRPISTAP